MRMRVLAALLSIGTTSLSVAACGASPEALCNMKCDCERCSASQYDGCVADARGNAQAADQRQCGAFYDDYLACQDATGFCRGSDWETSCGPEKDRLKRCMGG